MTAAAIYARYSSDLQRDASIEDQIRLCKERAKRDVRGDTVVGGNVSGAISKVTAGTKKFTVGKGTKKIEVSTTDVTLYFKCDTVSSFEEIIVKDAAVEVEMDNGVAVKVSGK